MGIPTWRTSLNKSLHAHQAMPESRFFQAASIALVNGSNDLSVENRTLVFRGFVSESNKLIAVTHHRSEKYLQWQCMPQSQICWYFTQTREQYRISSTVETIGKDNRDSTLRSNNIRATVWEKLSGNAQAQFLGPIPKQSIKETNPKIEFDEHNVPASFIVLIFTPSSVDYLNIATDPQRRVLHQKDKDSGKWSFASVNP